MYTNLNTNAQTIAQWIVEAKEHAVNSKAANAAQKITALRVTILFVQFLANHYAKLNNEKQTFSGLLEHARLSIYAAFGTDEKTADNLHAVRNRIKVLNRMFSVTGVPPMEQLIKDSRRIIDTDEGEAIDVDMTALVTAVLKWRTDEKKRLDEIAAAQAEKIAQGNKSVEATRIAELENKIRELEKLNVA